MIKNKCVSEETATIQLLVIYWLSQCYGDFYDASDDPFTYFPRLTANAHVLLPPSSSFHAFQYLYSLFVPKIYRYICSRIIPSC
jgi:hypothetical protein